MDAELLTRQALREPGTIENDVLIGRREQLFLARGGHDILDMATGVRAIPPESFAAFRANIIGRRACAQQAGVPYLHVIFPDKQSVLREDYVVRDPICLGESHLGQSPDVADSVFYPLDMLRQDGDRSFIRTDTHLSDRGTILTVCRMVELLTGTDQSEARGLMLSSLRTRREVFGDLGDKLMPRDSCTEIFAEIGWKTQWLHNEMTGGNNGIVDLYFNPAARQEGRVLWFGDSFGREAVRFLTFFFSEIVFLRTPFFHPDMFDSIKPTLLITENVERYLAYCASDEDRPSFFMFPHLAGIDYRPSREFSRAFSAMLSGGRAPYRAFKNSQKTAAKVEHPAMSETVQPLSQLVASEPSATPAIPVSEANAALARKYGVSSVIHADDYIYRFVAQRHGGKADLAVANYLELGRYSAGLAQEMVSEVTRIKTVIKETWRAERILDFASGFGCVSRHLQGTFPDSRISTCDIHAEASRFNRTVLGLNSLASALVPEEMTAPEQDAIFAMSFFSHLPRTTFARWIRALGRMLAPGGALVFTANGFATHSLGITGVPVDDDGFGFLPRSEQLDLEGGDYGITISHPAWVMAALATDVPELRLVHFREAHWWAIQDTYVCIRR